MAHGDELRDSYERWATQRPDEPSSLVYAVLALNETLKAAFSPSVIVASAEEAEEMRLSGGQQIMILPDTAEERIAKALEGILAHLDETKRSREARARMEP